MGQYRLPRRDKVQRNMEMADIERRSGRFWRGYQPAQQFLVKVHPKAKGGKKTVAKDGTERVTVYLLRFRSKTNPVYAFLKIGISNQMADRFGFDSHRYDVETVRLLRNLHRREAKQIEARLHQLFAEWSHAPRVALMSKGNTECFEDQIEIIDQTAIVFAAFKEELERCRSSVDRAPVS